MRRVTAHITGYVTPPFSPAFPVRLLTAIIKESSNKVLKTSLEKATVGSTHALRHSSLFN